MWVGINQIKKGSSIKLDDCVYYVVDWQHVKPGKGNAFVRTKLENIKLGTVIDRKFRSSEKVEVVYLEKKNIQYLYSSNDMYEFLDHETYDQISIHRDKLGKVINYLKENLDILALVHENQIIALQPPIFIDMKIVATEAGIRGDTSRAGTKPAKTETGMTVLVPLFIKEGEVVRIDTRTNKYVGRS